MMMVLLHGRLGTTVSGVAVTLDSDAELLLLHVRPSWKHSMTVSHIGERAAKSAAIKR